VEGLSFSRIWKNGNCPGRAGLNFGGVNFIIEHLAGSKTKEEGGRTVKSRFTITEVAEKLGVSPKTVARWEKVGKIRKPKRDWRGWRVYDETDVDQIKEFHEAVFEV